jgi:hypothetical protein
MATKCRTVVSWGRAASTWSVNRVSNTMADASRWFSEATWASMVKWLWSTARTRLCFSKPSQAVTTSGVL